MRKRLAVCCTCKRPIYFAGAYRRWVHRKPSDAYQSGPGFCGGQHVAKPTEEV